MAGHVDCFKPDSNPSKDGNGYERTWDDERYDSWMGEHMEILDREIRKPKDLLAMLEGKKAGYDKDFVARYKKAIAPSVEKLFCKQNNDE